MSEIKNGGLHQYGAEPFEQLQFGTAGVEWVKTLLYELAAGLLSYNHEQHPVAESFAFGATAQGIQGRSLDRGYGGS